MHLSSVSYSSLNGHRVHKLIRTTVMKRLFFPLLWLITAVTSAVAQPHESHQDNSPIEKLFVSSKLMADYYVLCDDHLPSSICFKRPQVGRLQNLKTYGEALDDLLGVASFVLLPKSEAPYLLIGTLSQHMESPADKELKADVRFEGVDKILHQRESPLPQEELSKMLKRHTLLLEEGTQLQLLEYSPTINLGEKYPYPHLSLYKVKNKGVAFYLHCFYDASKLPDINSRLSEKVFKKVKAHPTLPIYPKQEKGAMRGIKDFDNKQWK